MERPSVLVVDDDREHRELVCEVLHRSGFDAIGSPDGAHALDMLRVGLPSVVLLDLHMPGKDGWQVLAELRQSRRAAAVPVLIMSAMPQEALNGAVVAGYLEKPISAEELVSAVRRQAG